MKITLNDLKDALQVSTLSFFQSKESKRLVSYNPPNHKFTYLVMTKVDEEFDPEVDVYATILEKSEEYPWIGDYNFVAVISNKEGAAPVMSL